MQDNETRALVSTDPTVALEGEIVENANDLRGQYALKISVSWQKSVEAIFETGRLLIEARERLGRDGFVEMIGSELPFSDGTALRLMKVAKDQRLTALLQSTLTLPAPKDPEPQPIRTSILPSSWYTLYELTQLTDDQFKLALDERLIRSDMDRKQAIKLKSLAPGRPNLTVRSVKQPPRKKPGESPGEERASEKPKDHHDVTLTLTFKAAEILLLRDVYLNVIDTAMVRTWLEERWPWQQEPRLPFPFPDTHALARKLKEAAETVLPSGDQ
ncbi:MAG: hypothetical protein HQL73_12945 [Magnetococcales bacterium]|nr:hypothetical protein [Magnetococcales bacterium]